MSFYWQYYKLLLSSLPLSPTPIVHPQNIGLYKQVYDIMDSARPGNILLSGHAYIENAQPVPGKPRTVILDVYLFGAPDEENNKIACSLHFFKGEETLIIAEGLYNIVAMVLCFLVYFSSHYSVLA